MSDKEKCVGRYGEPWSIGYSGSMRRSDGKRIREEYSRIVTCVNSLAGIADPEKFMEAVPVVQWRR